MRSPSIPDLYKLYRQTPAVTTDSRKAGLGKIFFALKGDNFNGNQFAEAALMQGCSYVVVDDEKFYQGDKYILVKDCLAALQEPAKYHRGQLKIPFISITGSNGKTTTKEFIKSVLSEKYRALATEGNLNNHIGVPLTLLSITPDIEIAIIEMGANHVGEIAMLCEIAQPGFGLITNIGRAHIGEFGSFEAIIKAKTEMYEFIRKSKGKVFINSSNELLMSYASELEKITYGSAQSDFCSCQLAGSDPFLAVKFENETIVSNLTGKYNFENLAAAICVGKYFGVEPKKIREAIERYVPSNNRSQIVKTKRNTLVLDAYNANPSSMKAAIENFYDMQGGGATGKWMILGDMRELGKYEVEEHKNILQFIAEKGFQNVVLVGSVFSKAFSESKLTGFTPILYNNSDEVVERLKREPLNTNLSLILVKGSRGIKLEKVVEFL